MKVYVTGPSGSGTSTIGKLLSQELGIVQQDSDQFFWEDTDPPFTKKRDVKELHDLFHEFTSNAEFILSGDVLGWGIPKSDIANCFTHVIYLYAPWEVREKRIRKRESERFGDRVSPGGDMYEANQAFLDWASRYDSGDLVGRSLDSQKDFIEYFSITNLNVLKITESVSLNKVFNSSLSFLVNSSNSKDF